MKAEEENLKKLERIAKFKEKEHYKALENLENARNKI